MWKKSKYITREAFFKILVKKKTYTKIIEWLNPWTKKWGTEEYLFELTDNSVVCYMNKERDVTLKISRYTSTRSVIMHIYSIYYRIFDLDKPPNTNRGLHNKGVKQRAFITREDIDDNFNFNYNNNYIENYHL